MGKFEEDKTKATNLPADLPSVREAIAAHPDGAIYTSDNTKRYRLRHPRWVEIVARQEKTAKTAAPAAAAKK